MLKKGFLIINWVIPSPFKGSGGHRNIFRAMKYLGEFGHVVNLFTRPSDDFSTGKELESFINKSFFDIGADSYSVDPSEIGNATGDPKFATAYPTVYDVVKNKKIPLKLYFVQDFEPLFSPMGDCYILAENTYKMGLKGISSGPWCAQILKEKYGMECHYFMLPVDRDIYYPREVDRKNKLLFFARPDYPRRCYNLGLRALKIFHEEKPETEIVLYGSDKVVSKDIPFKHVNAGLLPTVDNLAELYSSARAGLVFSTTNPSLVPYEMMACRCAVIDIGYNNNALNYGSAKNVVLAGTMPEEIAGAIVKLFEDDSLWRQKVNSAYNYVKHFPGEVEMARRIETLIYYYLVKRCSKGALKPLENR